MAEYLKPHDPGEDVILVQYNPAWPTVFADLRNRIVEALGAHAIEVHHAGSTSVPGLAAKAIIDIVLARIFHGADRRPAVLVTVGG